MFSVFIRSLYAYYVEVERSHLPNNTGDLWYSNKLPFTHNSDKHYWYDRNNVNTTVTTLHQYNCQSLSISLHFIQNVQLQDPWKKLFGIRFKGFQCGRPHAKHRVDVKTKSYNCNIITVTFSPSKVLLTFRQQ